MKISFYLFGWLLILLFSVPVMELTAASVSQELSIHQKTSHSKNIKTTSRLKKLKAKKRQGLKPFTKGILAAIFGAVSIFAVIGSIAASFALSTAGVYAGIFIGLGAGVAAIFLGLKARKELKASGEKGSIFAILGIVFGSIAGAALLILSLGALFG